MFCLQNKNVYEIVTNSQRNMKTKISGNKNFQTISYRIYETFSAYLWFTRNEMDLDYYHQKLNVRITSRVVERRSLLNCMLGRIVDVLACLRVFLFTLYKFGSYIAFYNIIYTNLIHTVLECLCAWMLTCSRTNMFTALAGLFVFRDHVSYMRVALKYLPS